MKENKGNKKRKLVSLSLEAKVYKTLHKTIESLVDDCRFQFTKTGLVISIVDRKNVAMYSTKIEASVFNEYTLKNTFEVGWDFGLIASKGVMKPYNNGTVGMDIFEIEGVTDEDRYLCELRHDIFRDSISLPSTNTIRAIPKRPELKSECIFDISVKALRKIAERDEHVAVVFENGDVSFADAIETPKWTTEPINFESKESGTALYSTDYIVDMMKSLPQKNTIEFKFSSDYPCELSCEIVEGFTVNYLLAPRIKSD